MLFGHPDLHRVLKDMTKQDAEMENSPLDFATQMAAILIKNLEDCLNSRASWILVELLEHDNTRKLVVDDLKKNLPKIKSVLAASGNKGNKGLEIVL